MSLLSPEMELRLSQVHGQILPEQGLVLAELAAAVPNERIIVEVGAYKGKSSCYLAAGSLAGGRALLYSVDLWEDAPWPEYSDPAVKIAWTDNIGHLGLHEQAIAVQASSQQAAELIDGEVGLLFVDSDHSFDGACNDIEAWEPRMGLDGMMVFHDADTEDWGVAEAIRRLLLAGGEYQLEMRERLAIVTRSAT